MNLSREACVLVSLLINPDVDSALVAAPPEVWEELRGTFPPDLGVRAVAEPESRVYVIA